MTRKLVLLAALLAAAGCEEKQAGTVARGKAGPTPEYRLALQNSRAIITDTHPTVPQFKTLLTSLDAKYTQDAQQIADASIAAHQKLESQGVTENLMGMLQTLDKSGSGDFQAALDAYVAKRKPRGR